MDGMCPKLVLTTHELEWRNPVSGLRVSTLLVPICVVFPAPLTHCRMMASAGLARKRKKTINNIYNIWKFFCHTNTSLSLSVLRTLDKYLVSRILIFIHPGSNNRNKRRGKICCPTFFCSHKYHKTEIILFFNRKRKNVLANFYRIIVLFTQKIVTKLSKIWVWDPQHWVL